MTAQTLYARNCRTLDDVKAFYGDQGNTIQQGPGDEATEYEDENRRVPDRWIDVSLALKDDLSIK